MYTVLYIYIVQTKGHGNSPNFSNDFGYLCAEKKNYITIAVTSAIHDLKKLADIKTHDLMQGCKGQFNLRTITTSILIRIVHY